MRAFLVLVSALLGVKIVTVSGLYGFINSCPSLNYIAKIDTIVSPGRQAEYFNSFVGSMPVGPNTTNTDLLANNCSSCSIKTDKSAYWFGSLFRKSKNGSTATLIRPNNSVIFYIIDPLFENKTEPIPEGLRMIVGNASATSTASLGTYVNITMTFGNSKLIYRAFPDNLTINVTSLTARVTFPNCLHKGWNNDTTIKDHTKFTTAVSHKQPCPDTHFRIPRMIFRQEWKFNEPVSYKNISQCPLFFHSPKPVLGNAYAFHVAFQSGWANMTSLINNCKSEKLGQCRIKHREHLSTVDEPKKCKAKAQSELVKLESEAQSSNIAFKSFNFTDISFELKDLNFNQ